MSHHYDRSIAWGILAIVLIAALSFVVRVLVKGRVHYQRIEQQDHSPLLGKGLMEMGYWSLQPLARILVSLEVSASTISWCSVFFGAVAGFCLAFGYFGTGTLFALIAGLFDSVDGMIARMTGTVSQAGKVLDSTLDRYVEFFFLAGLIYYYRQSTLGQCLALLALLGSFMVSYSTAVAEIFRIQLRSGGMRRPDRIVYMVAGAFFSALIPLGYPEYPMLLAMALVGIFSNVSAYLRWQKTRELLQLQYSQHDPLQKRA